MEWGTWDSARMDALEQARWLRAEGITPREALQALGVTAPPAPSWDLVTTALEAELVAIREARAILVRKAA